MSDMNLAIRVTQAGQLRLGIGLGCIMTLCSATGESATAQVPQAASASKGELLSPPAQLIAGQSGRFSTRRVLVQLPRPGEPSPSDVTQESGDKDDQQSSDEKKDDEKAVDNFRGEEAEVGNGTDKKDSDPQKDEGKGVTPLQSSDLRLGVDRVNISTSTIGTGILPDDTAAKRAKPSTWLLDGQSRGIVAKQVIWRPASICHLPLYFEDAMLERHGHVRWGCAQPIVSGAKFLTTIPLLPYIATMQPKCEPRYTLGHFRPGSCAPALRDHLPWDGQAAAVEVVSLGGLFWAAPL